MRELRFRAWVYYGERLEKPNYSRDYDSLDRFFEDHDENDIDQCIEQYTGLKDKNGKEIYEGDIVIIEPAESFAKTYYGSESRMLITGAHRVYFEYGVFLVEETADEHMPLGQYIAQELEVVGNIHENPELLKKEK